MLLAEPPNLLIHDDADKVYKPYERSAEEQNYRNNDTGVVLNVDTLDKTVDGPYDVKHGNAENKLRNKRKLIHSLEKIFHR